MATYKKRSAINNDGKVAANRTKRMENHEVKKNVIFDKQIQWRKGLMEFLSKMMERLPKIKK